MHTFIVGIEIHNKSLQINFIILELKKMTFAFHIYKALLKVRLAILIFF